MNKKIHLFWWTLNRKDGKDNFGDMLAPFIAEKLSGKNVVKVTHPMNKLYRFFIKHYVTVGSVIGVVSRNSIVWGSGIIRKDQNVRKARFIAVRGPRTRNRLLELGYDVPAVYGDPALLLPKFISKKEKKKYVLGIIPHYSDYESVVARFKENTFVKVINLMTSDVEKTVHEILTCEKVVSSSLHGVVVSHAYEIPALWVKFSDKLAGDNVKFYDYFESLDLIYDQEFYVNPSESSIADFEKLLRENTSVLLPSKDKLIQIQEALLASCPFKK